VRAPALVFMAFDLLTVSYRPFSAAHHQHSSVGSSRPLEKGHGLLIV
jgi:hypothetical protein